MAIGPEALEPGQRDLLRRLLRGERIEEVADALEVSTDQIETDARGALVALDPALAALVAPEDRRLVAADFLTGTHESAAVGDLLDRSPDARRWLLWLGEAARVIAPDATVLEHAPAEDPAPPIADQGPATGKPSARSAAEAHAAVADTAVADTAAADTAAEAAAAPAPLSRGDIAILAATTVLGFVLLALGIALS